LQPSVKNRSNFLLATEKKIYVLVLLFLMASDVGALDRRAYQHGVRLLKDQHQKLWVIWSSSPGNPPQGEQKLKLSDGSNCTYFNHDIYFADVVDTQLRIVPQALVQLPEAQEPVDAAINRNGIVAITFEDGSESRLDECDGIIAQRYQLFPKFPDKALPVRTFSVPGAHSGHISTVGEYFVAVYAEGWIDGEEDNSVDTANDIYLETLSATGESGGYLAVTRDNGWPRDWWPLIAGAEDKALVVWQRYVKDSRYASLMFALYDPATNTFARSATVLKQAVQYYHYDVQYLSSLQRYLVVGNYLGETHGITSAPVTSPKMFAVLMDLNAKMVDYWEADFLCQTCGLYPNFTLVREARPAISESTGAVRVLYPVKPDGIVTLSVGSKSIQFENFSRQDHAWFPMGTDGTFVNENEAVFVNLTQTGLKLIRLPALH